VPALPVSTSIGQSLTSFFDAVGQFFADLAAVHWPALLLGLLFFGANLTLRSRAFFNSLRAAYPAVTFQWRRIWGAYFAAVGFNNVVPARGGDVIKLFLARSSIPGSRYPTVAAAFFVESVFDATVGVLVLIYAFTQGVFPKPPDFSKLSSFDISFFFARFRFTLFLITLLAIAALVAFALLSVRARAFWLRVRQGVTILTDKRRYLREVAFLQALAWLCRFAAFWFLLEAFRVGGSVQNVLLVFGVNQVAGAVPFTPGGAGVQQALLVKVFSGKASTTVVAAYSVGQQIAIAAFTALTGLAAIVFIFRFRSFREVISAGRASQREEKEAEGEGPVPYAEPVSEVPAETDSELRDRRRRERRAGTRH
jgi:glycosyltransferase 2 family protein